MHMGNICQYLYTMGEEGEMEKGRGGGLTCEIASSTCRADWSVAEGIVELESFIC